jgi:uncharacterized protein
MSVFVDTSALYAVLDENDPNHGVAGLTWRALLKGSELVTHNYIHVEAEAVIRRRLGRDGQAVLLDRLLPAMTTTWVDRSLHDAAVAAARTGDGASLVDQVSFLVMRQAGIELAFAFDTDFDARGFKRPSVSDASEGHRLAESPAPWPGSLSGETDLVGVAEIAARSGHPTSTVQSWRRRHASFPLPYAHLASGPIWRWPSIEGWIRGGPRRPGGGVALP